MNICDAIKATTTEKPCITREAWKIPYGFFGKVLIRITPTDTPDCCIIISSARKIPCNGWQPKAEDLVAEDWIAVEE